MVLRSVSVRRHDTAIVSAIDGNSSAIDDAAVQQPFESFCDII